MCAIIELNVQFPARHTTAAARCYLEGNHPTLRQKRLFCPILPRSSKLSRLLKLDNLALNWDNLSEEVPYSLDNDCPRIMLGRATQEVILPNTWRSTATLVGTPLFCRFPLAMAAAFRGPFEANFC